MGFPRTIAKFSRSVILGNFQGDRLSKLFVNYFIVARKPELDRKNLIILSALEKVKYGKIYTEIYGIVAGEEMQEIQQIEQELQSKGLHQ